MIQSNLENVWEKISKACQRSGRKKEQIQLVAVTKGVPAEQIAEAVRCGVKIIGENKVQESLDKFQAVHAQCPLLQWHLIGHLQRNKVNRASEIFNCVQSVDSERLAQSLDRRGGELGKVLDCLAQVKISDEPSKSGMAPDQLEPFLEFCSSLKNVRVRGLMAIAPYLEQSELQRPYFAQARKFFEQHFTGAKSAESPILSMGMSGDFETAIEEGANMVRVGTLIFGPRQYARAA